MVNRLRQFFEKKYQRWLDERMPSTRACRLDNRKLFIFPSREGLMFLLVILFMWLLATNYENNVIFGFASLLAAMFVIAIFHTYANLYGLEVKAIKGHSGFVGDVLEFEVQMKQDKQTLRDSLKLSYPDATSLTTRLEDRQTVVKLPVRANQRGWLDPGRLSISSVFPLGIVKVWTHLRLDYQAVVYPRPLAGPLPAHIASRHGEGYQEISGGSEDFFNLARYQPGEPQSGIAWKQYARELGLFSKHYTDPVEEQIWLDWDDFPGLDTETRLSRLCGLALAVDSTQHLYGLRLPGLKISPDRGEGHREQVLRALALYGLDGSGQVY